jgi:glutamine amidotransferase
VCRHLAYLGPEVTLASLVLEPAHGLLQQSFAPRLQAHGRLNADGYGVGWWSPTRAEPARHRRAVPLWSDRSFASWAGVVSSGAVVAAVRSATPPYPVEESCAAPFSDGRWLFSLNGAVSDGAGDAGARLRATLGADRQSWVDAPVDSALVFALLRAQLADGVSAAKALAAVVTTVDDVAPSRLNLLLSDGETVLATTHGDTLFVRRRAGSVLVASEPDDDAGDWAPVPPESLVEATRSTLSVTPL